MKNVQLYIIVAVALCLIIPGCKRKQPQNGGTGAQIQVEQKADVKAPDFALENYDGTKVSLGDYKGKIVVLEWFNYECPFSKYSWETARNTANLAEKYAGRGVVFLAINSTAHATPEKNKETAEAAKLDYPILDDRSGRVGRAYGAKTTPHMFVIDKEGYIVYDGAIDNAPMGKAPDAGKINYVDQAISELLAGKPVSIPKTDPYGCSVKYAE